MSRAILCLLYPLSCSTATRCDRNGMFFLNVPDVLRDSVRHSHRAEGGGRRAERSGERHRAPRMPHVYTLSLSTLMRPACPRRTAAPLHCRPGRTSSRAARHRSIACTWPATTATAPPPSTPSWRRACTSCSRRACTSSRAACACARRARCCWASAWPRWSRATASPASRWRTWTACASRGCCCRQVPWETLRRCWCGVRASTRGAPRTRASCRTCALPRLPLPMAGADSARARLEFFGACRQ